MSFSGRSQSCMPAAHVSQATQDNRSVCTNILQDSVLSMQGTDVLVVLARYYNTHRHTDTDTDTHTHTHTHTQRQTHTHTYTRDRDTQRETVRQTDNRHRENKKRHMLSLRRENTST